MCVDLEEWITLAADKDEVAGLQSVLMDAEKALESMGSTLREKQEELGNYASCPLCGSELKED